MDEPKVILHTPGPEVPIRVEVVSTDEDRQRGLMFRQKLDVDAGMLFVWDKPQHLTFWMKNTYIPLDMVFIGADRRIVGVVENAEPMTETSRSVPGDSQYVLEINGGQAARLGLRPGQAVDFVGF